MIGRRSRFSLRLLFLVAALCLASCRETWAQQQPDGAGQAPHAAATTHNHAVFRTNLGDLIVEFLPGDAPKTVAQIQKLIALGLYDGVAICRIEPGFVAQVDDVRRRTVTNPNETTPAPLTAEQQNALAKIPAEFGTMRKHRRGILSMARPDNNRNGGESSFSLLLGTAPHLDNNYTIFGRVVRGLETLTRIEQIRTGSGNAPTMPVVVQQATLLTPREAETFLLDNPTSATDAASISPAEARHVSSPISAAPLTLLILIGTLATTAAVQRRALRLANALALGTFLFAFFLFFSHLVVWQKPGDVWQKYYAVAAFLGALLCFKMMARFDDASEK